jgi:hypothetical protein
VGTYAVHEEDLLQVSWDSGVLVFTASLGRILANRFGTIY